MDEEVDLQSLLDAQEGYVPSSYDYTPSLDLSNLDLGDLSQYSVDSPQFDLSSYLSVPSMSSVQYEPSSLMGQLQGSGYEVSTPQQFLSSVPSNYLNNVDTATLAQSPNLSDRQLADEIDRMKAEDAQSISQGLALSQFTNPNMSRAAWAEAPSGTSMIGETLSDLRPAQSYVAPDGHVVGMVSSGADYQNPYDYATGPDGKNYVIDTNTGKTIGLLGEDGSYRSSQQIRVENQATQGGLGKVSNLSPRQQYENKLYQKALDQLAAKDRAQNSGLGKALSAAQAAALLYKAIAGKNQGDGVKKAASTIENIGPKFYAQGGKVDLPERVSGGLLPVSLHLAKALMNHQGLIPGDDGGQSDTVDIKAAPGEYIFDAETVSALGDGNTHAGAKKLDEMRYNIREHKRAGGLTQIAAKAKAPEHYLRGKK